MLLWITVRRVSTGRRMDCVGEMRSWEGWDIGTDWTSGRRWESQKYMYIEGGEKVLFTRKEELENVLFTASSSVCTPNYMC